jgi:shikimate kinase
MATLWLIGMMGSGKSTIGLRVGDALGLPFVDLDRVIALEAGIDVARIFAEEGEEGFRGREAEAVRGLAGSPAVVACGGGVVLDPANVATMRRGGKVAWLDVPIDILVGRVGDGDGRPLLAGDAARRLEEIAAERIEQYAAAAHWRIECGERAAEEVAGEVVRWWRST